jgi:hypothetical protein
MTTFSWRELLSQWSADILASPLAQRMSYLITPTARATNWLGASGATEEQIRDAETRLGSLFPASYRTFLAVSNGWSIVTHFTGQVWSTDEVGWLSARHGELIDSYTMFGEQDLPDDDYFIYGDTQDPSRIRTRYLHSALEISDPFYLDGDFYLLNPRVVTDAGEWEAWVLNAESCTRYRSFWELMQAEYQRFLDLKDT